VAKSDCDHALGLKPGLYGALAERSLVESALNDFDAAVVDAKAAIASDPKNAWAYDNLGKIYADHGNEDLAGATLDKAALLDPGAGNTYVTRASVDLFQHDFPKTLSDARTAARLGFGSPLMSALEGYSAIALDRNADAITAFRRRLEQEPNSSYAPLWLALAELRAGVTLDDALRARLGQMNSARWPGIVGQMFLNKVDVDAINAFVAAAPPPSRANYGCEAGFYTGEKLLLENKRELAEAAFRSTVGSCPRSSPSAAVATAELARMQR
jgi:tetratricopeptide (TPR) repeat protein